MSVDLFGFLLRGWVVGVLAWVTCAFLMCGLMMIAGDTTSGPAGNPKDARNTMWTCLFIWPVALVLQLVAWLTDLCWFIFRPVDGPIARVFSVLGRAAHNRWPPHPAIYEANREGRGRVPWLLLPPLAGLFLVASLVLALAFACREDESSPPAVVDTVVVVKPDTSHHERPDSDEHGDHDGDHEHP